MYSSCEDIEKVFLTKDEISDVVKKLGEIITKDYYGKNLLVVCVLKGSMMFFADLLREINLPCQVDFIYISSYGSGAKSSGNVKLISDLKTDVKGYDVLIIEDIIDTGLTISYLKETILERGPKSVKICTLLNKPSTRIVKDLQPEYTGCYISNGFVVGYGLDYNEKYRNLPFIGILKSEIYA